MPFPLTISGEIALPPGDTEAADACDRIVGALEKQGAHTTLQFPPDISLRVPIFRGFRWNWDLAATLDRIDLKVVETSQGRALRYRLSLVRLAAIATAMILWMAFTTYRTGFDFPIWTLAVMWSWLIGGNYVFTWARANNFFRRAVAQPVITQAEVEDPIRERARTTGFPPINWP